MRSRSRRQQRLRVLTLPNRRKSQLRRLKNRFLGCFSGFRGPKSRVFDRNPLICIPYLELLSRVASNALDSTTGASGDTKSTDHDTKSTDHDTKSTDHDILTTLRDTFTTLCARREFRLTSNRLELFDCANSRGRGRIGIRVTYRGASLLPESIRFRILVRSGCAGRRRR